MLLLCSAPWHRVSSLSSTAISLVLCGCRKETTTFHGAAERDYQGRTYLDPPSDKKNIEHRCFLPKKYLHTWAGHTGAVSAIRFFPQYGHILLSSSLDGQLKVNIATARMPLLI